MQIKRILIVDSATNEIAMLNELTEELGLRGFEFLKIKARPVNGARLYGFFFPLIKLVWFLRLIKIKYTLKIETIICVGSEAKNSTQPAVHWLKLKCFWLELPEDELPAKKRKIRTWVKQAAKTQLLVFTDLAKTQHKQKGLAEENIYLLPPAIRLNHLQYQENIFHNIAQAETMTKKFFNVGVISALSTEEQVAEIELVFNAIKQTRLIIPNIQLIVLGEGNQKKKLLWLAKKMDLESLVWLVGEQQHLKKWLQSFDAFVSLKIKPTLNDFSLVLKAMETGLPVIVPRYLGFEDIIKEDGSGLFTDKFDGEALASQLIRLKQDRRLALKLSENARLEVKKNHDLNSTVEIIKHIL